MNRIYLLLLFVFCKNAFGITTESLVHSYGKPQVMKAIARHIEGGFTAEAEGVHIISISPDLKYVNATTLNIDIRRSGLTPDQVKTIIEKNLEIEKNEFKQKNEQERQIQLDAIVLRESRIKENKKVIYMQEKELRIDEAKKSLEKHRKEYFENERVLKLNREKILSPKVIESESKRTEQTAKTYSHYGVSKSFGTSDRVNPSDLKAYDALLSKGMSRSEAMEAAPIVRKACENIGGKDCR